MSVFLLHHLQRQSAWALLVLTGLACAEGESVSTPPHAAASGRHPVTIVAHPGLGRLDTGRVDIRGGQVGVACSTCHAEAVNNPPARRPNELDAFHKDMEFAHGGLACASCHHPDNRELLRLADGETLAFSETILLCAQCHGPQYRDYRNGSHGGMSGYWDLGRGPRVRNHCINCHDPHAPAFPQLLPAPPPRDRIPPAQGTHHE